MRIKVVSGDFKMNLPAPIPKFLIRGIIINRVLKGVTDGSVEMSKKQSRIIAKVIRKSLKKYKGLTLVEVASSDGDYVKITL